MSNWPTHYGTRGTAQSSLRHARDWAAETAAARHRNAADNRPRHLPTRAVIAEPQPIHRTHPTPGRVRGGCCIALRYSRYDRSVDPDLPAAIQEELRRRWSEPHRKHHTVKHLDEVISGLDTLATAGETFDHRSVILAAWFHDAIYNPKRTTNERDSARLAQKLLGADSDLAEVQRLVLLTKHHAPLSTDSNGIALSDADLAVLGSDIDSYREYALNVRAEYKYIPSFLYKRLRINILEEFAKRPSIYHSATAKDMWENQARSNIAEEINTLKS